jgi:hypothetical protein
VTAPEPTVDDVLADAAVAAHAAFDAADWTWAFGPFSHRRYAVPSAVDVALRLRRLVDELTAYHRDDPATTALEVGRLRVEYRDDGALRASLVLLEVAPTYLDEDENDDNEEDDRDATE